MTHALMLQSPWVKTHSVLTKDFNVTKYEELIHMVSDSTLNLTFKKSPIPEFCTDSKNNIHKILQIFFVYFSQKHIKIDWMQKDMKIFF